MGSKTLKVSNTLLCKSTQETMTIVQPAGDEDVSDSPSLEMMREFMTSGDKITLLIQTQTSLELSLIPSPTFPLCQVDLGSCLY